MTSVLGIFLSIYGSVFPSCPYLCSSVSCYLPTTCIISNGANPKLVPRLCIQRQHYGGIPKVEDNYHVAYP